MNPYIPSGYDRHDGLPNIQKVISRPAMVWKLGGRSCKDITPLVASSVTLALLCHSFCIFNLFAFGLTLEICVNREATHTGFET